MPKNYAYRIDRDTGFAPNTDYGVCSLTGCKNKKTLEGRRNIEELAESGSWVIGIGGNNTGKSDRLIYAMETEKNLLVDEFRKRYPGKSKYLVFGSAGSNVLISSRFYYLGDNAVGLPKSLSHLIESKWRWKCFSDSDIDKLIAHLSAKGFKRYGIYGRPNNQESEEKCRRCQIKRQC